MKKRTIIVGALVAATGMVTVGALAASGGAPTNPEAGPLPEGVTVVTQEVYDDAFAKFEACMNESGAGLAGKAVKRSGRSWLPGVRTARGGNPSAQSAAAARPRRP